MSRSDDLAAIRAGLRARIEAGELTQLLDTASERQVRSLQRIFAAMGKSAKPRKARGRPRRPDKAEREFIRFVDSMKSLTELLVTRRPITDKEAAARYVDVCFPNLRRDERVEVVKLWRSRIAGARKKFAR